MQQDRYVLPARPAGSDELAMELYSEQHIDPHVKAQLEKYLLSAAQGTNIKMLILGAKCGLTAELLLPLCSHLDLVELQPFKTLLQERFCKVNEVEYFFGKEGFIGSTFVLPKPNLHSAQVRVISAEEFASQVHSHYDLVLLQNCIITEKVNLVKELIKIQHEVLVTMIVPGRILTKSYFPFICKLEKFVLMEFYSSIFHEQIQNRKNITARREEIIYYEVFGWKKISSDKDTLLKIRQVLDEAEAELPHQPLNKVVPQANIYETPELVDMYLNFHFGANNFGVQNYPYVCSQICIQKASKLKMKGRALDLGCAVGRTSIDLAQYFDEVVGLDYSEAFIKAAQQALVENYEHVSHKVRFVVGDACNLDPSLGKFNLVFGGNLVDRLPDPTAFLNAVASFLQPNGLLILTSPYSWLEQYTPKQKWLGGYIQNGVEVSTTTGIRKVLEARGLKEFAASENVRFCIKQNEWVYQYTLACATFWQKQ